MSIDLASYCIWEAFVVKQNAMLGMFIQFVYQSFVKMGKDILSIVF